MTRHDWLHELLGMPDFLEGTASWFAGAKALEPGAEGGMCFLEQVWHLADLERRGYGDRIRRILTEERPALHDFDGAREAREGRYRERSLGAGLAAFRQARTENLALLRPVSEAGWQRAATQAGVGELRLEALPRMMAEHDASHRAEIAELRGEARSGSEPRWGSRGGVQLLGLLLFLPLLGCPYESPFPLGAPADTARDARLLGQWRCVSGSDEKAFLMTITPFEDRQYSVLMTLPGEEPFQTRAYVSTAKGGAVLNVQEVKNGKAEAEWMFARYVVPTRNSLVFELAEDELLKDSAKTAAALRAALEGPKRDAIFEPLYACARVEAGKKP